MLEYCTPLCFFTAMYRVILCIYCIQHLHVESPRLLSDTLDGRNFMSETFVPVTRIWFVVEHWPTRTVKPLETLNRFECSSAGVLSFSALSPDKWSVWGTWSVCYRWVLVYLQVRLHERRPGLHQVVTDAPLTGGGGLVERRLTSETHWWRMKTKMQVSTLITFLIN